MTISVVIPNYNGAHLVKKNIPDVIKAVAEEKSASIIVVDDGSRREDVLELRKVLDLINMSSGKPVSLIEREKNGGFSSAVNTGVKAARGELVVLLNSDTAPQKGFLKPIIKRFEGDEMLFGVGCMDLSVEGKTVVERGRGIGYWNRGLLNHKRGGIEHEDTFWVSGGSSVVRRDLFNKLGGFDELYNPFYWEDIDLSYRARKANWHIRFERNSKVEHRHDEGAIKSHFKKKRVTTLAYRNQFIFHWKNITDVRLLISHVLWLPVHILQAILRGDMELVKGFALATLMLPDIIKHRHEQSKLFVRTDREIIT